MKFAVLFLSLLTIGFASGDLDRLVTIIVSQQNHFHQAKTEHLVQNLREGLSSLTKEEPVILIANELGLDGAPWTIVPILPKLTYYTEADWFFFITEDTLVDFKILDKALEDFDPKTKELFLGHTLSDKEPVIVHHYLPAQFISYPFFPAGFLLSKPALLNAVVNLNNFNESFNIEPQMELAIYLKYHRNRHSGKIREAEVPSTNLTLTKLPQLCVSSPPFPASGRCATVQRIDLPDCSAEGPKLTIKDIHVGVKTFSEFHEKRLPVIRDTWGPDVEGSVTYFSDKEDEEYSTIETGIPNTRVGHCGKAMVIVKRFYEEFILDDGTFNRKWLVIADDDTLLSVPRLLRLLRCYDHTHPILLGEVYGFQAHKPEGYEYVTGGGGMVLSAQAVYNLVQSGDKCRSANSPDDMFLGAEAEKFGWDVVHSSLFHQSQPPDYPAKVLRLQNAVSFHRHSLMDPLKLYRQYLDESRAGPYRVKTEL